MTCNAIFSDMDSTQCATLSDKEEAAIEVLEKLRKRANKDESEKVNNAENKEHHDGEKAVKKLTERAKAQVIASSKKENEEYQKALREGNKRKRIDEENKDKAEKKARDTENKDKEKENEELSTNDTREKIRDSPILFDMCIIDNREKMIIDGKNKEYGGLPANYMMNCYKKWAQGNMKKSGPKLYSEWAENLFEQHAVLNLAVGLGFEKIREIESEFEKIDPDMRKHKCIETALYLWKMGKESFACKNIHCEKISDSIIVTLEKITKYCWSEDMKLAFHMLIKTIK